MNRHETDLERMADDIGRLAGLVDAPCDRIVVDRTLEVFQLGFKHCPVEFRTTARKAVGVRPEVSFRYIDPLGSHDPYQLGVASGALRVSDRPVDRLVPELQRRFSIFGYGVDATATYGLEKIWPFIDQPRPLEDATQLASLPPSLTLARGGLERLGLTHFCIIAADYRHASVNVYFLLDRRENTAERVGKLVGELVGVAPSGEMLAYNSRAAIASLTFSWNSESVERMCLYVPEPVSRPGPVDDDALLQRVVSDAPILTKERMFVVGSSFGASGNYTKLEVDYTGSSVPLLQKWIDKHSRTP